MIENRSSKIENAENRAAQSSIRISDIDGFRALAMLVVFCYHTWEGCGSPQWKVGIFNFDFSNGPNFVDLFIVLSGFCLFMPLTSENKWASWNAKDYFQRRARRILPAYYAALIYAIILPQLLVVVFRLAGKEAKTQSFPDWWNIFSHATFLHNFSTDTWSSLNGSLWTMALEVHLYIAFPIIILGLRRFGLWKTFIAVGAVSLLYRCLTDLGLPSLSSTQRFLWQVFFLGRWIQFILGAIAVWIVMKRLRSEKRLSAWQGTMGMIGAFLLYFLAGQSFIQSLPAGRDIFLGLAFAIAIASCCLSNTPFASIVRNPLMTKLGLISYSLYLIHQPTTYYMTEMAEKVLHTPEGGKELLIVLPLSFLLCVLISLPFYWLFEKPFLSAPKTKKAITAN